VTAQMETWCAPPPVQGPATGGPSRWSHQALGPNGNRWSRGWWSKWPTIISRRQLRHGAALLRGVGQVAAAMHADSVPDTRAAPDLRLLNGGLSEAPSPRLSGRSLSRSPQGVPPAATHFPLFCSRFFRGQVLPARENGKLILPDRWRRRGRWHGRRCASPSCARTPRSLAS